MTQEEGTAVRAVSPPSFVSSRVILSTSPDASEEVSISPHLLPMSGEPGIRQEFAPSLSPVGIRVEGGIGKKKWQT